jgi:hypothetical protein
MRLAADVCTDCGSRNVQYGCNEKWLCTRCHLLRRARILQASNKSKRNNTWTVWLLALAICAIFWGLLAYLLS